MWRVSLVFNTLLMGVLSLASVIGIMRAHNNFVQYRNDDLGIRPLPALTQIALDNLWIYKAVPLLWLVGLIFLLWRFRKNALPIECVQLHTSATLFVGFFVLAFFCTAGILPFIPLIVGMSR